MHVPASLALVHLQDDGGVARRMAAGRLDQEKIGTHVRDADGLLSTSIAEVSFQVVEIVLTGDAAFTQGHAKRITIQLSIIDQLPGAAALAWSAISRQLLHHSNPDPEPDASL